MHGHYCAEVVFDSERNNAGVRKLTRHEHILVFSAFSSILTFLVALNTQYLPLFTVFVFLPNIINTDHKMMCPIQFQSHQVFLDLPNGLF